MKKADPERLARLEAMGADTSKIMLHGTNEANFTDKNIPVWKEFRTDKPAFLTPDAKFAEIFSNPTSPLPEIQQHRTIPVFQPKGTYFDYENPEHIKNLRNDIYANSPASGLSQLHADLYNLEALSKPLLEGESNWIFLENLQDAIKKAGYTGYYETEKGIKNTAVFDPAAIKSIWAQGKGPGLIGGTAAAALLSAPSESHAVDEAANPLKTFAKLVGHYRNAQEQAADWVVEKTNLTGQPPTEQQKAMGHLLIDPLNLVEGPVGHALMGAELMSWRK